MTRMPTSASKTKRTSLEMSTKCVGKRSTRQTKAYKSRHVFFAPVDFVTKNGPKITFPTTVNHGIPLPVPKKAQTVGSGGRRRGGVKKHPMTLRCPSAPYHRTSVIMDMHDTPNRSLDLDITDGGDAGEDAPVCEGIDSHQSLCYGTLLAELSEAHYDELFRCDP